jgi:hypothetical protein
VNKIILQLLELLLLAIGGGLICLGAIAFLLARSRPPCAE